MPLLQIDERKSSDGTVEILWDNDSDETFVHVESLEYGTFDVPTSKELAHDVFDHAYAYRNVGTDSEYISDVVDRILAAAA
jgi:hypothetical protein